MIKNHFSTSVSYIKRAPFQALSIITILAITFFVSSILAILVYATHQIVYSFETRPQIIAFLKPGSQQPAIDSYIEKLKTDTRVKNILYVSREDALDIYKNATADNPTLADLVSPQTFPASIEFSVNNIDHAQEVIEEVSSQEIVENVSFTAAIGGEASLKDVVERLKRITLYVRITSAAIAVFLAATSFIVLTLVTGMRITTRKNEIDSLSLIGAGPGFIRTPMIFEAMNYTIIGVLAGWTIATVSLMYAAPTIMNYFGDIPVLPKDSGIFFGLLGGLLLIELGVGMVIALFGSTFAISRALKSTR